MVNKGDLKIHGEQSLFSVLPKLPHIFLLLLILLFTSEALSFNSLDFRYSNSSEKTRIVFEFKDIVRFEQKTSDDNSTLTLSIYHDNKLEKIDSTTFKALHSKFIKTITYHDAKATEYADIVFDLQKQPEVKIFYLKPIENKGFRIIVDLIKRSRFTILLDPGHGGVDLGSTSPDTFEKDVNLHLAKYLQRKLTALDGIEVLLTRTDDRFLYPHERPSTHDQIADLFISLHGDAMNASQDAKVSVWVYQDAPSSGELGQALVKNESEAILLGNVADLINNADQQENLSAQALAQIYKPNTKASKRFANLLTQELNKRLAFDVASPQSAKLVVLASTSLPSILLNIENLLQYEQSSEQDDTDPTDNKDSVEYHLYEAIVASIRAFRDEM